MSSNEIEILIELLKQSLEKPDSTIVAASVTVIGMVLVTSITVLYVLTFK